MKVDRTMLEGVLLIKPKAHNDSRGFFCETFNLREYREQGITANFVQDVYKRQVLRIIRIPSIIIGI